MTKLARDYFKEKGWKYHLQGSRSKDDFLDTYSTPDSDWDYFLDDDQHRAFPDYNHLSKEGWVEKGIQAYQDASTTRVFEKNFPDGRVQVSLRWRYDHMCRAWDSIASGFYGKYLNKRSKDYAGKEFVTDFMSMLYHMKDQVFFIKPVDTH